MESLTTVDNKIKIVVVGDPLVGKSCSIAKYLCHHPATKQPSFQQNDSQPSSTALIDLSISMDQSSLSAYGSSLLTQGHLRQNRVYRNGQTCIPRRKYLSPIFFCRQPRYLSKCSLKSNTLITKWYV